MSLLFLDTANIEEIKRLIRTSAISGVTTNPSLMAKESKGDYLDKLCEIADAVRGRGNYIESKHLSVEVTTLDPDEILREAEILDHNLPHVGVDVFVKVPVTLGNLRVITYLTKNNIQVNATACMTALQAKMAADAGAQVVSFFYNRIKDGGENPDQVVSDYCFGSSERAKVICGSIRSPKDVVSAWEAGADIVTASTKIISEMIQHPQTDKAIAQFQKDIDSWRS